MTKRMDPQLEDLGIGSKIRELRQKRRYTLQELSSRTGLSKPLLSQVENGRVMPPVATLLKISRALEVGISHFFQDGEKEERVGLTRAEDRQRLQKRPHQNAPKVGYVYESLEIHKTRKRMQPLLVSFELTEEKDLAFYAHEGEECLYLLEGEVEFRTPDDVKVVRPGDCLYFDSEIPHALRSLGSTRARALVVLYTGEREP